MDDLQRIAFRQQGGVISVPRDDVAIVFHDDSSRANLQLFQQARDTYAVLDLFFFAVDFDFHVNKKTVFAATTRVVREYGLSLSRP